MLTRWRCSWAGGGKRRQQFKEIIQKPDSLEWVRNTQSSCSFNVVDCDYLVKHVWKTSNSDPEVGVRSGARTPSDNKDLLQK